MNLYSVSPAYGDISLALVEYSNEGGPGPSYNMKEVPGSTLIIRAVHVYPEPLSLEAGDKETRGVDLPHHQSKLGKAPSHRVHTLVEMKQGQCICPLSWSVHCNITGEGKCNERGWAGGRRP